MNRRRRRRLGSGLIAGTVVLGAAVVVVVVLSNHRYRSFYLGSASRVFAPAPTERARQLSARAAPATRAMAAGPPRVQTFGLPLAFDVPGPPAVEAPAVRRSRVRVPSPDAEGRVRVPISDSVPGDLPAPELPPGWDLTEFSGRAGVEIVRDEGRVAVRLQSARASFALHRDLVLDLRQYPMLQWSWKAIRLPRGGDAREPPSDDQVAQIYLVILRWPFPRVNSHVLGYIWDTRAPAGTRITNPRAANVRSIVVESGYQQLGLWVREERNAYQDYRELFGREPVRVGKIALMTDSNDTATESEVLLGDLVFFGPPSRNAGISSPYATIPHMSRSKS